MDGRCIGAADRDWPEQGCPHPPAFVVAGDLCCHFHLVRVVRMRIAEVGDHEIIVDLVRPDDEGD